MDDHVLFFKHGPNLAVYRRLNEMQEYWERRWSGTNLKTMLRNARTGDLGELEALMLAYLPKDGLLLEAGCGPGRIVCALAARGYHVEGIDYAADTIARARLIAPIGTTRQALHLVERIDRERWQVAVLDAVRFVPLRTGTS